MNQKIEEWKEVSVQEASTPSAGESESQLTIKSTHHDISEYEKLKLLRAVNWGLSFSCAAKVIHVSKRAANELNRLNKQSKRKKHDS